MTAESDSSQQSEPVIVQVRPIQANISPLGFLHYAREYSRAADLIPQGAGFSPVPYFLVCRSIELALKAFLLSQGNTVPSLKKGSTHNLVRALDESDAAGLNNFVVPSASERAEISKANKYYSKKGFEYFVVIDALKGYHELPSLVVLKQITQRLSDSLHDVCLNA